MRVRRLHTFRRTEFEAQRRIENVTSHIAQRPGTEIIKAAPGQRRVHRMIGTIQHRPRATGPSSRYPARAAYQWAAPSAGSSTTDRRRQADRSTRVLRALRHCAVGNPFAAAANLFRCPDYPVCVITPAAPAWLTCAFHRCCARAASDNRCVCPRESPPLRSPRAYGPA